MNFFTELSLTNFKSHAYTRLEFDQITALVGPNGCGKTSLLQAVESIVELATEKLEHVFIYERHPANLVTRGMDSFSILIRGIKDASSAWEVAVSFSIGDKQSGILENWEIEVRWKWGDEKSGHSMLTPAQSIQDVAPKEIVEGLGHAAYFKPHVRALTAPSHPENVVPRIGPDGSSLASTIAFLMTYAPERHKAIETELKGIVPIIENIRVRPTKVIRPERKVFSVDEMQIPYDEPREFIGHELIFDTTSAHEVPAYAMSEGTLLVLGLLTLLGGPDCPDLILLDDIEQGLHPHAQRELMSALRAIVHDANRQIILTSHSPYIIDALSADQVWVMNNDSFGYVETDKLSAHPDAEHALSVLTTGEFWDAEGESWVTNETAPTEETDA